MDFAVLTGPGKSLTLYLAHNTSANGQLAIRVFDNTIRVFSSSSSSWIDTGLVPSFTSGASWTTQTPTTNHLTITGNYTDATPYYTITLNGASTGHLSYFQNSPTVGKGIEQVRLSCGYGDAYKDTNVWLADNVSLVPEPSALVLLLTAVAGLSIHARRRC